MNPNHTAEFVRSVLDYNPQTGIFVWRFRPEYPPKWNTRFAGKVAGCVVGGYLMISLGRHDKYLSHRLAWLHFYGEWPENYIDHINRVRHDNRIANLRLATPSENRCNAGMSKKNTSGYIGVTFLPARWQASIFVKGKRVWHGTFNTAEEGHAARQARIAEIHGEFANLDGVEPR